MADDLAVRGRVAVGRFAGQKVLPKRTLIEKVRHRWRWGHWPGARCRGPFAHVPKEGL